VEEDILFSSCFDKISGHLGKMNAQLAENPDEERCAVCTETHLEELTPRLVSGQELRLCAKCEKIVVALQFVAKQMDQDVYEVAGCLTHYSRNRVFAAKLAQLREVC
jgi:hypothetical protein